MLKTANTVKTEQISLMNASPEDKLLFTLTRQQFLDEHKEFVLDLCHETAIDWEAVYATAYLHGVAPLIYYNLRKISVESLDVPLELANRFRQTLMENILFKERLGTNVAKAVSVFKKDCIDVMLVKGIALDSLVYEQPWYTAAHDVDLVIRRKRSEVSDEEFKDYMVAMHRTSVEYDYFEHHDVTMNHTLPVDFERIWDDATTINFRGQNVFVMCPEDFLASVCINSCRKRYFRLKALCDIAEIVNAYPDLNWTKFVTRVRLYDCRDIVYTALLVTTMTLGCDLPNGLLDSLATSSIRARVIRWISRRMALTAYASLYSKNKIRGRSVNWPLILPYATFRWYQIWRRLKFSLSTSS